MKLPNWQHNSGKDQKRTLKPQALRQAKKRRSALKKKLLFGAAVLGILSVQPANALTWKEFWEPFQDDHHHHYHYDHGHHGHYHRPRRRCEVVVHREMWVPGNYYRSGYMRRWSELEWRRC